MELNPHIPKPDPPKEEEKVEEKKEEAEDKKEDAEDKKEEDKEKAEESWKMTDQLWSKGRAFLLVTGASRGLGRAFAQELSACLEPESTVFLTARSKDALQDTANTLRQAFFFNTWAKTQVGIKLRFSTKLRPFFEKLRYIFLDNHVSGKNRGNFSEKKNRKI